MLRSRPWLVFFLIFILTLLSLMVALPSDLPIDFTVAGKEIKFNAGIGGKSLTIAGKTLTLPEYPLKEGLDIQGGMQVVLEADMGSLPEKARTTALKSAQTVIERRVDLYGIGNAQVQTSQLGNQYRILVELPGVQDTQQALELVGKTAQLDFRLEGSQSAQATASAQTFFDSFQATGLTGSQLLQSQVTYDQKTNKPQIAMQFNDDGTKLFGDITAKGVGKRLGIFVDQYPIALPTISQAIPTGQAVISGDFATEEANQLVIQLNSGALPVPLKVVEQRVMGASLGQASINQTIKAGLFGLGLVMLFMILNYGFRGTIAVIALALYGVYTIAIYKLIGVSLTVPGIAGLLLSIGMAVDSNILIFERMKEELRLGRPFNLALERGFDRAWNSIKDANIVTLLISLILMNPLHLAFLNSSGLVIGFGLTLFLGVLISLFTGIVVSRNLMRLFLKETGRV